MIKTSARFKKINIDWKVSETHLYLELWWHKQHHHYFPIIKHIIKAVGTFSPQHVCVLLLFTANWLADILVSVSSVEHFLCCWSPQGWRMRSFLLHQSIFVITRTSLKLWHLHWTDEWSLTRYNQIFLSSFFCRGLSEANKEQRRGDTAFVAGDGWRVHNC